MRKKIRAFRRGEQGYALLFGMLASIILIMFAGGVLDLGFYYARYQNARETISMPVEQVEQMLAMYSNYANDATPRQMFQDMAEAHAVANGWEADDVTTNFERVMPTAYYDASVQVNIEVTLEGTYHCFFLPLLGIDTMPIRVQVEDELFWLSGINAKFYNGGIYYTWSP